MRASGRFSLRAARGLARSVAGIATAGCGAIVAACVVAVGLVAASATNAWADIVVEDAEPLLRLTLPGHTAEVRALAFAPDSSRLISGGLDKAAIVWNVADADGDDGPAADPAVRERNIVRRQARDRVLRWQVARGQRGAIQALAFSPAGDPPVVAIGGYGSMGSTGEILLVDARDGTWIKTLGGVPPDGVERRGHRQSIFALTFTADGGWLVSQDLDGQVFAWKRAEGWKPVELVKREEVRLGASGARDLRRMPALRPLATLGADRVAIPVLESKPDAETPIWKVGIFDLARPDQPPRRMRPEHLGVVTALAATSDGRRLVSADYSGQVIVYDLTGATATREVMWEVKPVAESLAILPDGSRVAVGVATAEPGQPAHLEVWNCNPPRKVASRGVPGAVRAVCASPDGGWVAWTGGAGHAVLVERTDSLGKAEADVPAATRRRLGGIGQQITRVSFSTAAADEKLLLKPANGAEPGIRERNIVLRQQPRVGPAGGKPPRRIVVARGGQPGGRAPLDAAFDIQELARSAVGQEGDWAPAAGRPAGWTLERAATTPQGIERWQLAREGRPGGIIDLAENDWQGRAGAGGTAIAWLRKDEEPGPWAVAIGTKWGIFIYELAAAADRQCRLVRWFRGNEDGVLSLAVSEDGRWLASGGADGIVMVWSLSGIGLEAALTDRWGVSLNVETGRAVVATVDAAGPLAGRDVRAGDVIARISYFSGRTTTATEHAAGAAIRTALAEIPWNTQVEFTVERGKASRLFTRNPAWENIAALHLADDGEWAWWTPRGYYAASANGDRIFGWLVNRGLDRLPRFFQANQFRRKLERPDVVSRLLVEGSLDAALRAAGRDVPESSATVLPRQIALAPELRILTPRSADVARGGKLAVRAEVLVPEGNAVDRLKAFASGVPAAAAPRLVEDAAATPVRPRRQVYEWEIDLPEQDRHLVNVFASTREGPTDEERVHVRADGPPPRLRAPRLYVIAAGVDRYAHAVRWRNLGLGLDDLQLAVKDAGAVRDAFTRCTRGLYEMGSQQLLADEAVTGTGWKEAVDGLVNGLRGKVEPDDMLVVFLAGHGVVNADAERAYAYLCHDADLRLNPNRDLVLTGQGVIGWADLAVLADVPCRKLALIDTCHSGALGPASRNVTIREFQEHQIVILAAADDHEGSQESDAWGHGAFTKVLVEGLEGRADTGSRHRQTTERPRGSDGVVSLDELITYVREEVPKLTTSVSGTAQTPQASPVELLEFVALPLAKTGRLAP